MEHQYNIYINDKLCNSFTVLELKELASSKNINITSKMKKNEICRKLVMCGVAKVKKVTIPEIKEKNISKKDTKKRYESIEELLKELKVEKAIDLVRIYEGTPTDSMETIRKRNMIEIEKVIEIADLKKKKEVEKLSYMLKDYHGDERVKRFLLILAEKYCKCLKGVEASSSGKISNPICSSSIFGKKELKGPGASYQCDPIPLLLVPAGKKYVLLKK